MAVLSAVLAISSFVVWWWWRRRQRALCAGPASMLLMRECDTLVQLSMTALLAEAGKGRKLRWERLDGQLYRIGWSAIRKKQLDEMNCGYHRGELRTLLGGDDEIYVYCVVDYAFPFAAIGCWHSRFCRQGVIGMDGEIGPWR